MQTILLGHVKWFDNRKGFGFVRSEQEDEDIFIHYSNIEGDGFKALNDGDAVEFEFEVGPKGLHAKKLKRADSD